MDVYGAALKMIYLKFRQRVLHSTVYALAVLAGMQMLWGSIEVWPQTLSMLLFAFAITLAGKTVFNLRKTTLARDSLKTERRCYDKTYSTEFLHHGVWMCCCRRIAYRPYPRTLGDEVERGERQ